MYSFSRPRTGEIRSSYCAASWWCLGATNDEDLLAELLLLCCCIKYRLFVQFGSSKGTRQEKTHSKKAHDIDVDRYDDDYDNGGGCDDDDNDYGTTGSSAKDDWKRKEGTVSAAAAWAVEVSALMYTTVVLSAGGPLW